MACVIVVHGVAPSGRPDHAARSRACSTSTMAMVILTGGTAARAHAVGSRSRRDPSEPRGDPPTDVYARFSLRNGQPRRAALIAATSIFFMSIIASKARLASAPPAAIASISTRGVICHETPHLSLHQPHALSWPPLPTMAFQ